MSKVHIPVLLKEVLSFIDENIKIFVDLTVGTGGHSLAVFEKCKDVFIVGMDRDEEILEIAEKKFMKAGARFRLINDTFSNVDRYVKECDAILMDLGVSSLQIDKIERGFSYRFNSPIDMRMGLKSRSFEDFMRNATQKELEYILREYGDFKRPERIAQRIIKYKREKGIHTTYDFNEAITGKRESKGNESFLSRVYQSFRIYLNDELNELKKCLIKIPALLRCGGILIVISYHSGEDRIVKKFIKESEYMERVNKKVIKPSPEEVRENPRSRSAKMRVARRMC